MKKEYSINRKYKDRLFTYIFGREENKENLLSLLNAITDSNYTEISELEINTIEDVIYMKMKNDVSCIISNSMVLFEQQSTINPNMAFREFEYCANLFDKFVKSIDFDLYGSRKITIPTPKCIVLYNGTDEMEDLAVQRLSDYFAYPTEGYEWTSYVYNINYGHNKDILDNCQSLREYSEFIFRIRENIYDGMDRESAVDYAVKYMISKNGCLSSFFENHRAEVCMICLTEYDEELHKKTLREEGIKEGTKATLINSIIQLLVRNNSVSDNLKKRISLITDVEILSKLMLVAADVSSLDLFEAELQKYGF